MKSAKDWVKTVKGGNSSGSGGCGCLNNIQTLEDAEIFIQEIQIDVMQHALNEICGIKDDDDAI